MTERQQIEKEINEICMLQIGFRTSGYHVTVNQQEKAGLAKWKAELQARRQALLTPEEIACENSLPF